ncbi:ABC transporter ATP-binding protein [Tsukamurella spumae]|uniref:ABC transporter ATP-binding protein n=1 Tax=Tsukamurella spumae TaxID=44753 RepID=A0A846X4C2_9ACTN|nr:ABC transporter ATP-binding protein [Tsukamurella spumae]NKY19405.1 ABC transporter ATP-binding protein [Tsukamurella spumae]
MTAPEASTATVDTVIRARDLRRTYGSGAAAFEAVRGIDLDIRAGEVFALLGTNGASKTSTLDLLEGLAAPSGGELAVFGMDPRADRRRVRPLCGIMLQAGGLPGELTVRESIEMWRGTCSNPTTADAVLDRVRLTDRADVRVRALSGGEQRRVDLACALIGQPRLLFLDEPTTGLDPESRRATWNLLAELKRDGVTMVLTTHYLDEAEALADRIAIMHRGTVARLGTLGEIVEGHPAEIVIDDPAVPLPAVSGAWTTAPDGGGRVALRTHHLQDDLRTLLDWAADRGLALSGLQARHPSLESVFLAIASEDDATAAPEPIGARA